jgi:YebC/PmpR family DNA-binding regulatory protein
LKAAVDKALLNNLSKESIDRNINGGNKDPSDLVQLEYECYGPNGIQIVIKALSDNSNRTIANINGYLAKLHGEIAKTNSVKIFFDNYGVIILKKKLGQTKDNVEEVIIMNDLNGYVDSEEFEDSFEVKTDPSNDFYKIKDALKNNGFEIFDAEIKLVPQNYVSNLNEDATQRIIKFIDCCNEDDDIQSVVTN